MDLQFSGMVYIIDKDKIVGVGRVTDMVVSAGDLKDLIRGGLAVDLSIDDDFSKKLEEIFEELEKESKEDKEADKDATD